MTLAEIFQEIGYTATQISMDQYGKDIMEIKNYRDVCKIIKLYKQKRKEKAHPEMTPKFLWEFITSLD